MVVDKLTTWCLHHTSAVGGGVIGSTFAKSDALGHLGEVISQYVVGKKPIDPVLLSGRCVAISKAPASSLVPVLYLTISRTPYQQMQNQNIKNGGLTHVEDESLPRYVVLLNITLVNRSSRKTYL